MIKRLLAVLLLLTLTGSALAQSAVPVKQDGQVLCAAQDMAGSDTHNHRQGCLHADHCAVTDPPRLAYLPALSFAFAGITFQVVPEDADAASVVLDLVDPPPRLV